MYQICSERKGERKGECKKSCHHKVVSKRGANSGEFCEKRGNIVAEVIIIDKMPARIIRRFRKPHIQRGKEIGTEDRVYKTKIHKFLKAPNRWFGSPYIRPEGKAEEKDQFFNEYPFPGNFPHILFFQNGHKPQVDDGESKQYKKNSKSFKREEIEAS